MPRRSARSKTDCGIVSPKALAVQAADMGADATHVLVGGYRLIAGGGATAATWMACETPIPVREPHEGGRARLDWLQHGGIWTHWSSTLLDHVLSLYQY
jgi:hypothetical protein